MPTIWLTGSSAPCLSVYKPFYFGNDVLNEENFIAPTSTSDNSYWWQWEKLHRNILKNYPKKFPLIIKERNELEEEALLKTNISTGIFKIAIKQKLSHNEY